MSRVNVFQGIGHVKKLDIHVYKDCQTMNQLTKISNDYTKLVVTHKGIPKNTKFAKTCGNLFG